MKNLKNLVLLLALFLTAISCRQSPSPPPPPPAIIEMTINLNFEYSQLPYRLASVFFKVCEHFNCSSTGFNYTSQMFDINSSIPQFSYSQTIAEQEADHLIGKSVFVKVNLTYFHEGNTIRTIQAEKEVVFEKGKNIVDFQIIVGE